MLLGKRRIAISLWLPPPVSHRARAMAMAGIPNVFAGMDIISFVVGITAGVTVSADAFDVSVVRAMKSELTLKTRWQASRRVLGF